MQSLPVQKSGKLPKFSFKMNLPTNSSKELRLGTLSLKVTDSLTLSYLATSGCPGYQFDGSTNLKGRGPIPGCNFAQVTFYGVLTRGIFQPNVKGIEGTFYPITPSKVLLKGTNIERSLFGIHFDANVAGSAGCIVLRKQNEWDSFRKIMKDFEKQGIECLMLDVAYT